MSLNLESEPLSRIAADRYQEMADQVLGGESLTREQALSILKAPDVDVLSILSAGFRIRHQHFGKSEVVGIDKLRQRRTDPDGDSLFARLRLDGVQVEAVYSQLID